MSDSYISDKAPIVYKDNARTAADDRYARLSIVQQIESDLGLGMDGKEINFATAQRLKRFNIRTMSPVEMFKFQLIRKYRELYNITDDELVYLTNICDRIPYVQFRNTGGMLYAYRLVNAINLVGTQEEVLNVLKDAKEKSVPTFDIYRYHRFLSNLGLIGRFNKSFKVKI